MGHVGRGREYKSKVSPNSVTCSLNPDFSCRPELGPRFFLFPMQAPQIEKADTVTVYFDTSMPEHRATH